MPHKRTEGRMSALESSTPSAAPAVPSSAWSDREIDRYAKRIEIFIRRGLTVDCAERLADRLARRDREKDDRRCCDECSRLVKGWRCGADADRATLPGVLQRCDDFGWQTT